MYSIRNQQCGSPECGAIKQRVTSHGQKRKRFKCGQCGATWSAARNTPWFGLRSSQQTIQHALELSENGFSIRKIAAQLGVSKNTIVRWKKKLSRFPST